MNPKAKKLKVLSFVYINNDTLRLIRKSARIANRLQAELIVVHIVSSTSKLTENKKIAIIELEQLVVELGGDFRLLEGKNTSDELLNTISKIKPDYIVLGEPSNKNKHFFLRDSVSKSIANNITESHIWIVGDFTREISE